MSQIRLVPTITEEPLLDRAGYANLLNSQEDLPLLSFRLSSDGLYRCELPSHSVLAVKEVNHDDGSSKVSRKPNSRSVFYSDIEQDDPPVRNTPANRVEALLDMARRSGRDFSAFNLDPVSRPSTAASSGPEGLSASPGPNHVERNISTAGHHAELDPTRRAAWHAQHKLSQEVALQKRNVRQFEAMQRRIGETGEAKEARRLRERAMAAFVQMQVLGKSNALGKTWATIAANCSRVNLWMTKLEAHRERVQQAAQMKAVSAITMFMINRLKAKRMRKQADVLIGFLRFIKRDGQIKGVAKKLKWILMKLQCLIIDHVQSNKCQVALIGKKYEKVMAKYLPEMELLREAAEAKAEKVKKSGEKKRVEVPPVRPPLPQSARDEAILRFVVTNRQEHVLRVMEFEETLLWPVMVDVVREKRMFGNPLEARKFCKRIRQKGTMYQWIIENGGGDALEGKKPPRYSRFPTEAEIISRIYEAQIERCRMEPSMKHQLDALHSKLRKDMKLDQSEEEEAAAKEAAEKTAQEATEAEEVLKAPKRRRSMVPRNSLKKTVGKGPLAGAGGAGSSSRATLSASSSVRQEGSIDMDSVIDSIADSTHASSM